MANTKKVKAKSQKDEDRKSGGAGGSAASVSTSSGSSSEKRPIIMLPTATASSAPTVGRQTPIMLPTASGSGSAGGNLNGKTGAGKSEAPKQSQASAGMQDFLQRHSTERTERKTEAKDYGQVSTGMQDFLQRHSRKRSVEEIESSFGGSGRDMETINRKGQGSQSSRRKQGRAPMTTSGGYYSMPEADTGAMERYSRQAEGWGNRLQEMDTLYTAKQQELERLGGEIQSLTSRLPYSQMINMSSPAYAGVQEQLRQLTADYAAAQQELGGIAEQYNTYLANYNSAVSGYDQEYQKYREGQEAWRQTIRTDQDAIQKELEEATASRQAAVQQRTIAENRLNALSMQAVTPETAAETEALQQQLWQARQQEQRATEMERLLQEELTYSRYYSYEALRENPDFEEKSRYRPAEADRYKIDNFYDTAFQPRSEDDYEYRIVNKDQDVLDYARLTSSGNNSGVTDRQTVLQQMTDDEVALYNYLYASDPEDAKAYLDILMRSLNARNRQAQEKYFTGMAAKSPWAAAGLSLASVPAKTFGAPIAFVGQIIDSMDGEIDQNAPYNSGSYIPRAIRGEVSRQIEQEWGPVASYAYQQGMSMADSFFNRLVTGQILGGFEGETAQAIAKHASLTLMSSAAAADTVIEGKDKGLSDDQAFSLGIIAGAAEYFSEEVSLETLLDKTSMGRSIAGYIAKNFISEGSEEVVSDFINLFADVMISQDESEWRQDIRKYEHRGESKIGAFGKAFGHQLLNMAGSFLGGGISGAVMGGTAVLIDAGATRARGQGYIDHDSEIRAEVLKHLENEQRIPTNLEIDGATRGLIETGLSAERGSEARTWANKLLTKAEAGEEITAYELGRQAQLNEIAEQEGEMLPTAYTLPTYEQNEARRAKENAATEATGESTNIDTNPTGKTAREREIIREYRDAVDEDLVQFVQDSVENKGANRGRYELAPVSERAAADILEITGVDTTGFKTVIEQRMAEHIYDEHGPNGSTDHTMADLNDIGRLQYVLDNYDNLEAAGKANAYTTNKPNGKQGLAQTVQYSKAVDGTYYVIEAVPDTKARTTYIVSAYMSNKVNGENTNLHPADAEASRARPETQTQQLVSSPTNTISQPGQGVNGIVLPGNDNYQEGMNNGTEQRAEAQAAEEQAARERQPESGIRGPAAAAEQDGRIVLPGGEQRNDVSDRDGGRVPGTSTGGQAGVLGEGAEGARQRSADAGRAAIERSNLERNIRSERVNVREALGVRSAAEDAIVRVIAQQDMTPELARVAANNYKQTGKETTFTLDPIRLENGKNVNGVNTDNRLIIQANNILFSPEQLSDHEMMHDFIREDPGLKSAIQKAILDRYDREQFDDIVDEYIKRHREVYTGADENTLRELAVEELFCDAFAGMNKFAQHAERYQETVRATYAERTGPVQQSSQNDAATARTNGPPAEGRIVLPGNDNYQGGLNNGTEQRAEAQAAEEQAARERQSESGIRGPAAAAEQDGRIVLPGGEQRNDVSDRDGGRVPGTSTGGQDGVLGEGTEGARQRSADAGRAAIERSNLERNIRSERVNVREALGVWAAAEDATVRVIAQQDLTPELARVAANNYRQTGKETTFTLDPIRLESGGNAKAVNTADRLIVQANDMRRSPEQLSDHEMMHDFIWEDPGLKSAIQEAILDRYDRKQFDDIVDEYIRRHRKVYTWADENTLREIAVEELFCDAFAGTNRFAQHAERYQETVREVYTERSGPVQQSSQNDAATARTNGPPAEGNRYSAQDDENYLNALLEERDAIEERLSTPFAYSDMSKTDARDLENRLAKVNAEIDKTTKNERARAVRTPLRDIVNNLGNYRRNDLESIANQLSDNAWDGIEDLSREDLEQGIREIIAEREYSELEMQAPRYGIYVRPAETTAPGNMLPGGEEARAEEESTEETPRTAAERVERYSLNEDTIDYAINYTATDETTREQLRLVKDDAMELADIQSRINKEMGGRATKNIHSLNDYLNDNLDVWQRLWDMQQELAAAGIRCDFVTEPGTPNIVEGKEVPGGLKGLPIEYVASETGKRYKFTAFWRQMPQMMLDSMSHDSRERVRTEIMKGVEDAYRRGTGEKDLLPYLKDQFPTASEIKKVGGARSASNIERNTMRSVQPPLRTAEKTVMALNLNSACPMFTIGNNGCYLDACYLTQMANGATGTNLFRSAWYTGELLQIADSDIDLINSLGGLRLNGVGDTTLDNKSQMKDVIRHAGMRGLKVKIITKQRASLEVLAELYNSGTDVSHVTVQPSMDNLWVPAELDDVYGAGVRGTTQLAETVRAGRNEAAATGYEEMFGRATKIVDGTLYRKYGFSPEQIREMKEDYPFVQITPRYVVCTAAEIAEIALNRDGEYVNGGKVIQTLMHGKVPDGCVSDYPGELINFGGARHVVTREDGEWRFYGEYIGKGGVVTKVIDGPNTPYGKVMAYVQANYTPAEQNKIWTTLKNQMCCQANDFKDACAGCQSLCARGCGAFAAEDFDYRKYSQREKEDAMAGVRAAADEIVAQRNQELFSAADDEDLELADQTQSRQFKQWFGDWQNDPANASKVVNEDGTPRVVYHSTDDSFTVFDRAMLGRNVEGNATDEYWEATAHLGFWFNTQDLRERIVAGRTEACYLNIVDPYEVGSLEELTWILQEHSMSDDPKEIGAETLQWFRDEGYDGLMVTDEEFGGTSWVAFDNTQIKSATDNVGTFDPNNPDIRYSAEDDQTVAEQFRAWSRENPDATAEEAGAELRRIEKEQRRQSRKARQEQQTQQEQQARQQRESWRPRPGDSADTYREAMREGPQKLTVPESRPTIAKRDLRQAMNTIFSVPNGLKKETSDFVDRFADKILKNGKLTMADREEFFNHMYESGVVEETVNEMATYGRSLLKGRRFYVDETVREELGDDWNEWRQRAMGAGFWLTNDRNDIGLDVAWQELSDIVPGLFNADETDLTAMLERFVQVAEEGKAEQMPLAEYAAMIAEREFVPESKVIREYQQRMEQELDKFAEKADLEIYLRDRTGIKLAEQKAEYQEKLRQERERYRTRRALEQAERQETMERSRERRELRALQEKTLKQLQWLNKNRYRAPEELKAAFDEVLADMDIYAIGAANEAQYSKKYNATWRDLAAMYEEAKENDPNFFPSQDLERIVSRINDAKIADMDVDALNNLYKAAVGLRTEFYNRNRVLSDEYGALLSEVSENAVEEIRQAGKGHKDNVLDKVFNKMQLTPMNTLERLGGWNPDGDFYQMARKLEAGEREARKYVADAKRFLADQFVNDHMEWVKRADGQGKNAIWYELEVPELLQLNMGDKPIFSDKTVKVAFTPAQKVEMYLESKNTDNLRHMAGGRTFPDRELYSQGKYQEAFAHGTTVKLAPETVKKIVSDLTDEEQALADVLGQWYNNQAKEAIDQKAMILYGFRKTIGDFYAPIFTNKNYVKSEPGIYDATAEGVGNLKARQYSKNPSYQISAFDAFDKSAQQTSRFVGYAIPVRDLTNMMNHHLANGKTFADELTHAWDESSKNYILDLMTELQSGGQQQKTGSIERLTNQILSKYISATFGFNPSIVLKQAASFPLAAAYLGARNMPNLARALRVDNNLINTYTGELAYRTLGYATPETAQLRENPTRLQQSGTALNWIFGGGSITWMDGVTVKTMWSWAENKVRREQKGLEIGTQEQIDAGQSPFYQAVAREFNEAVSRSQPMYDTMHRSNIMREGGAIQRVFTLFKTVPQQEYNMIRQAIGEAQYYKQSGADPKTQRAAARKVGSAFLSIATGNLMIGGITLLNALLKNKGKKYRDDDDELTTESVMLQFARQWMQDNASVMLFGDTAAELIGSILTGEKWYGLETPGITQLAGILEQMIKTGGTVKGLIEDSIEAAQSGADWLEYMRDNSGTYLKAVEDLARPMATYATGLPIDNFRAYLLGLLQWISPEAKVAYEDAVQEVGKADLKGLSGQALEMRMETVLEQRLGDLGDVDESIIQELSRLYEAGFTDAAPANEAEKVTVNGEEIQFDLAQQQMYGRIWSGLVGDSLNELLASEEYQAADDEIRAAVLKAMYNYANEHTKAEMIEGYEPRTSAADRAIDAGATLAEWAMWSKTIADMDSDEKYAALRESDYDDDAKIGLIGGMMQSTEEQTEAGNLSAWGKMQAILDSGLDVDQYLEMKNAGAISTYLKNIDSGMGAELAYNAAMAIKGMDPNEDTGKAAKWRLMLETSENKAEQIQALESVMYDSEIERLRLADRFGFDPEISVILYETLPSFDFDGNGSYKQDEVEAAIDAMSGGDTGGIVLPGGNTVQLTNEEKAALWQIWTGSKAAKNNPYDTGVGQAVIEARG